MDASVEALAFFIVVALVPGLWFYFRHRGRQEFQTTLRLAIQEGKELTPELVQAITTEAAGRHADLRRGVIWLAIGGGLVTLVYFIGEPELYGVIGFPLLLGLAYLGLWLFDPDRKA